MKTLILYDNTAQTGFKSGWGFSCLVDDRILFDTGEAGDSLLYNMQQAGIEPAAIEAVAISHDHWDHTGGLRTVLQKTGNVPVYTCPDFSEDFKTGVRELGGTLVDVADFISIDDGISLTGQIAGEYKGGYLPEQALVLQTESGVSVINGCSHPGVVTMVENVKQKFPQERIYAVLGGFHLMNKSRSTIKSIVADLQDMGVEKVGPTHCTGEEARHLFEQSYGRGVLSINAGKTLYL